MSLDDAPPPTLEVMKGRLETLETEWTIATRPSKRRQINEEFKGLASEIKRIFGEDGARAVDEVVAKHKQLHFPGPKVPAPLPQTEPVGP
jgi:hypothetical protein